MKSDEAKITVTEKQHTSIVDFLKQVPDPRHARGVRYRYDDLLLMIIYALLAGHTEAMDVEDYVRFHFDYFHEKLGLETIPSHDTFSRIIRLTDFDELAKSLDEWLRISFPHIYTKYNGKKVMHVDGKGVKAATMKAFGERTIYFLNVMVEGESIGLGVQRVNSKENEITCLPAFLKRFNIKNTILTMDCMGCNSTVIAAIREGGGNYVMPLKENQGKLYDCVVNHVKELESDGRWDKLKSATTETRKHGRIEKNTMTLITNTTFIYEKLGLDSFYGSVNRVGVLDKEVTKMKNGQELKATTRAYFITDLEDISVENMLKIQKAHWNIEMQHWLLDMQLNEDRATARRDNAVTNGVVLRRFCLMVKKLAKFEGRQKSFYNKNQASIYNIEKLLFDTIQPHDTEN